MISSSWGAPLAFSKGFNLQHVADGLYGRHLYVYSWPDGELKQTLDLGNTGLLPLEVSIEFHEEIVIIMFTIISSSYIIPMCRQGFSMTLQKTLALSGVL